MKSFLASDRFERHTRWWCSGRVAGEVDELEPRSWLIARHGDRWLLADREGWLIVVGDADRDLVAENGDLNRYPPRKGFEPYLCANLLFRTGSLSPDALAGWTTVGDPQSSRHANRPATDVSLKYQDYRITIGVDDESGIWTSLSGSGTELEVERLVVGGVRDDLEAHFGVLDAVPDIDLSRRVPPAPELIDFVRMVETATNGLSAEVLDQDADTGEIRLVLIDSNDEPQAYVSRQAAGHTTYEQPLLTGRQHQWTSDGWFFHVDAASTDPMWARNLVRALQS